MKKYLMIFKAELMSTLQYIHNILFRFISFIMLIFTFMNLWEYMYSDSSELINGYSKQQMIWYVIITELIWFISSSRKMCKKICNDVKGGNITYNLNKPYSYIGFALFSHLGEMAISAAIYVVAGLATGFIMLKEFPHLSFCGIFVVIISSILAIVIGTLLVIFIGLFSFYIEDANPFYWLYSKLILVVGTIFPIEFFPKYLQGILTISPVYAVCYGPAKLFVDYSTTAALNILSVQMIYLIVVYTMCSAIYAKGVRRLNVNGG